jgi:hypothetical protein
MDTMSLLSVSGWHASIDGLLGEFSGIAAIPSSARPGLEQTGFDRWFRVTRYGARLSGFLFSTNQRFARVTSCI